MNLSDVRKAPEVGDEARAGGAWQQGVLESSATWQRSIHEVVIGKGNGDFTTNLGLITIEPEIRGSLSATTAIKRVISHLIKG
jgi:hypothetical protein